MRESGNLDLTSQESVGWLVQPKYPYSVLGDPEVTANINCNSRNLPNTDTQNYSTDLR